MEEERDARLEGERKKENQFLVEHVNEMLVDEAPTTH